MAMPEVERRFHRKAGAGCFNLAWNLLEKKKRTKEDDNALLHLVHTSRYHWGLVGTVRNMAVGDWQISRAYAAVGEGNLALRFARSSLELCEKNSLRDILHTGHEGVARAYAVGGQMEKARHSLKEARIHLDSLSLNSEDRQIYLAQIAETEALIK
jgi:hypothetical protein